MTRIVLIQGHPDPVATHFGHALASAYARAAENAGHQVRRIDVARLDFPLLHSAAAWKDPPCKAIRESQEALAWAEHIALFFPLWLGDMPAVLKGFFEQVLRPGFAFAEPVKGRLPRKLLAGRSARIVVTMGMPALFYRVYYRAHSVASLRRNILQFCGISPVRTTLIGMVEAKGTDNWLIRMSALGSEAR